MLLERLGSLDPQQRHHDERDQRRAQAVERRADRAVHRARLVEEPALEQRGDREQHARPWHAGPVAEHRRGVIEQPEVREQSIDPAIGRVDVSRDRDLVARRSGQVWVRSRRGRGSGFLDGRDHGSGQVWVRTLGHRRQRQRHLLGARRAPSQTSEQLADRLLGDAHAAGDLAVGAAIRLELRDEPGASPSDPLRSLRAASAAPERHESAVLEPSLMAAQRPRRDVERRRDLTLLRPALLDQADHRVRLGHSVADGVLRDRHARDEHDAMAVAGAHEAPRVDRLHVLGPHQPRQFHLRPGHGRTLPAAAKKRTGLGPHPRRVRRRVPRRRGLPLCQEVWNPRPPLAPPPPAIT
jgi:hypothetical protein